MSLVDVLSFLLQISNGNITNTQLFLLKKNVRIRCIAKDSHILSTTNNSIFAFVVGIYLTMTLS